MAFNAAYDTVSLIGTMQSLKRPARFVRDTLFSQIIRFNTRKIAMDMIIEDQRVAPFIAPVVAGRVRRDKGFTTTLYEAPYVKEKDEVILSDMLSRGPGEALGGDVSPSTRRDDKIVELLGKQDDRITRREELMCIELARTGRVTVQGDGYDNVVIDYQRAAGLTKVLTLGARWSQNTSDPLADMQAWSLEAQRTSHGGPLTTFIFDTMAAGAFLQRLVARGEDKLLSREYRGGASALQLGPDAMQQYYLGRINNFDLWVYQGQVELDNGTIANVLPDFTVIGASPVAGGVMAYGAVLIGNVLEALDRAPRLTGGPLFDPANEYLVTECAPLPVCTRINGTFCATVG
jgi:hypothetical protein